jgi:hypothetical protein
MAKGPSLGCPVACLSRCCCATPHARCSREPCALRAWHMPPPATDAGAYGSPGKFSPYHGFCRMLSQHASVRDGGTSVDGVSRAALNKMVGLQFSEGMRKPARNGNPGDLDSGALKLSRHFLRARWRDPDDQEDLMVLQQMFTVMSPQEVEQSVRILRDFTKWRPGPAGRGGDRAVRTASQAGLEEVLRNVQQRIAASMAEADRLALACDEDDDLDDDNLSMRSTVVGAPVRASTSKPEGPTREANRAAAGKQARAHEPERASPAAPVDKVTAMQGLIHELRCKNMTDASLAPFQPQPPILAEGASSADLLDSLFRCMANASAERAALSHTLSTASSLAALTPAAHRPLMSVVSSSKATSEQLTVPEPVLRGLTLPAAAHAQHGGACLGTLLPPLHLMLDKQLDHCESSRSSSGGGGSGSGGCVCQDEGDTDTATDHVVKPQRSHHHQLQHDCAPSPEGPHRLTSITKLDKQTKLDDHILRDSDSVGRPYPEGLHRLTSITKPHAQRPATHGGRLADLLVWPVSLAQAHAVETPPGGGAGGGAGGPRLPPLRSLLTRH